MQLTRFRFATDYQAGVLTNAALDPVVNASAYGHVAVLPQPVQSYTTATGAQAVAITPQPPAAGLPSFSTTNTQGAGSPAFALVGTAGQPGTAMAYTYQAGDTVQFTTTTRAVQIQLAGTVQAGAGIAVVGAGTTEAVVRNGVIASIVVDGAVVQSIDTANSAPLARLYLDGASHTVQVTHSGSYSGAVAPIGPVVQVTPGGASVASQARVVPLAHPTFVAASWRVTATDATHYSLYKTPAGGAEALVVASLVAGTHYTQYVPGVDLYVGNGSALVSGEGATFTTDVTTLAIESIGIGAGGGAGAASYTTPVLDSGDTLTQWFLAEWDQAPGLTMASVTIQTGNTPTPDASWATATITTVGATILPSGRGVGTAGLLASGVARGRYAVLTVTFPAVSIVAPWLRDLMVYAWVPERDPQILTKVGLPEDAAIGPLMAAYMGTFAVTNTELRQDVYDYIASYAISGAVDQYLDAQGADRATRRYTGEPPQSYRTRLLAAAAARTGGASPSGLCQQLAQLVTGASSGLSASVSGGYQTVTCQGVVVRQAAGQQCFITIPAPPYAGLPGLTVAQAQAIITQFITSVRPLGTVFQPNNTGNLVTFL